MPDEPDIARLDAVAQADMVRTGEVHPLELVDAAIDRIEKVNPGLNAVIHERFDKARAEAAGDLPDGPLRGVPMLFKDLDGFSAGDPYHAGSRHLKDPGFVAEHDSYVQARFKAAGIVLLGRTNTPELGLLPTTEPLAYGPTRNPWDEGRSTGGSSGGSACAVASLMVPLAHAGDGGGSIRIPASECGLVGLFPSRGRHSLGPEAAEAWGGLVRRLAVTRSVRDAATALDAIEGCMPGDPYVAPTPARPFAREVGADPGRLRIGILTSAPDPNVEVHPDCVAAVESAARLLESLGHDVEPVEHELFADADFQNQFTAQFINAYSVWTAAEVDELGRMTGSPATPDTVEPLTWALYEMGKGITGLQLHEAMGLFNRFTRRLRQWWVDGHDLMLTPTIPEPPPSLGQFDAPPDFAIAPLLRASPIVQFTVPFNVSGQPAISLPLHWTGAGLPIGVQLAADYGREDLLIRVASQIEAAAPWAGRVPPVHA